MDGNRLFSLARLMAMMALQGAGTLATTVPSLLWKNSPPELERGENSKKTLAQGDEGRQ